MRTLLNILPINKVQIRHIIVIVLILLLALILRLYNLDKHNLWYDESLSVLDEWGLNRLPHLTRLFDSSFLLKNNDYLSLYSHGFVYYWMRLFGKGEAALRLSSVMFSLLSIYFLYLLAKKIFNIRIASLVAFLIAISPFNIFYSQELRPYAAISFLTLIAAYSFLQILKKNGKIYYFVYAIANILNIYFHYTTVIILLSFFIFLIFNIKKNRHLLKLFLVIHIIILILVMPVLMSIYPNLKFILYSTVDPKFSEFPIWGGKIGLKHLLFTFKNFSIGYNTDYFSFIGRFSTLVFFSLFLCGIFKFYKEKEGQLFLFCLFVPILFLFFMSQLKTCYVYRYLFPVSSFYLLFVALGLSRLNNKIFFGFIMIIIVFFNFIGLQSYYIYNLPNDNAQHIGVTCRQNTRGIAKIISDNYKKGDRIVHTCRNTVFPLKFYIRQLSDKTDLIREVDKGTVVIFSDFLKSENLLTYNYHELHPYSVSLTDYKIAKDLKYSDRLWLVFSGWYVMDSNDRDDRIIKSIRKSLKEYRHERLDGADLYLFNNGG